MLELAAEPLQDRNTTEYYVTPDDLVEGIPAKLPNTYDQPFGNSSALPAYYCAKMARDARR